MVFYNLNTAWKGETFSLKILLKCGILRRKTEDIGDGDWCDWWGIKHRAPTPPLIIKELEKSELSEFNGGGSANIPRHSKEKEEEVVNRSPRFLFLHRTLTLTPILTLTLRKAVLFFPVSAVRSSSEHGSQSSALAFLFFFFSIFLLFMVYPPKKDCSFFCLAERKILYIRLEREGRDGRLGTHLVSASQLLIKK